MRGGGDERLRDGLVVDGSEVERHGVARDAHRAPDEDVALVCLARQLLELIGVVGEGTALVRDGGKRLVRPAGEPNGARLALHAITRVR